MTMCDIITSYFLVQWHNALSSKSRKSGSTTSNIILSRRLLWSRSELACAVVKAAHVSYGCFQTSKKRQRLYIL